jgi:hypothetical protein
MNQHQKALYEAAVKLALDVLTNGREVISPTGEMVRVQASAADINAAMNILKQGHAAVDEAAPESAVGQLVARMKAQGLKIHNGIPEVEGTDATDRRTA